MSDPRPTCPNVPLMDNCRDPTDEILGSNCMALISSPCSNSSDMTSLGMDPNRSPSLNQGSNPESDNIEAGLSSLYLDVDRNDTDTIELICSLLGLKDGSGENLSRNDALPLSKEFNGCNKDVIDRMRHRCQVHGVPLIQCNISFLNNLWNRCKNANETDTKVFDTKICPTIINNEQDYALEFIRRYGSMTPQERQEVFAGDEYLRKAWEDDYILNKLYGTSFKLQRDAELEEQDPLYKDKFFDELDVMQNCVLNDYTMPRHNKEYQKISDFYKQNGYYYELSEEAQEKIDRYIVSPGYNLGRSLVNRFCDYGAPRPPGFWEYENPLTIPNSLEILDNTGNLLIDNDEKRFSVYSGTYKCPSGTVIGDQSNPYLDFENPSQAGKDCNGITCIAGTSNIECMLQSKYHPEYQMDIILSEEDSQCRDHSRTDPENTAQCPPGRGDCSTCEPPEDKRAFWNSLNCKLRTANDHNIYGHSCDDEYAACVRYEPPDELKKLKNQFHGQLKRDNSPESGCICRSGDCSNVSGCDKIEPVINTNLTYPSLKGHNFLTDDMIEDRENLFNTLGNPTEPIYKCMRCGLRGTTKSTNDANSSRHIFSKEGITHSKHPDFLIFTTTLEADIDSTSNLERVAETNCTANDLFWYQNEKGYLENILHQNKTLYEQENSISAYRQAYEESEENIRVSAALYHEERTKRQEQMQALRNQLDAQAPRVSNFIKAAEQKVADEYKSKEEDLPNSDRNDYLFYIMGFIIFIILILFLVF